MERILFGQIHIPSQQPDLLCSSRLSFSILGKEIKNALVEFQSSPHDTLKLPLAGVRETLQVSECPKLLQ